MPDLTWAQVIHRFAMSMVSWVASGMPLVSEKVHNERYHGKCMVCPHRRGYWCGKCKCLAYLKTKLATEKCPDTPSRWQSFG